MASPSDPVAAGRLIGGRFRVVELLGEGSFAHVWRAEDLTRHRDVAVKVLKEGLRADREILERFWREVFAVASIDSPHVVRMVDFGTAGDEAYIAMEFVAGPTMRQMMLGQPWTPDAAHIAIGQIAQALAAAHERGIIHRDLKPENVVLVGGGAGRQVKVLDFGLAKMAELERDLGLDPLTRSGMCFGTPQYMSPEQMQGRGAGKSTDLWALAVMAYEAIAGHLPWDGETARDVFYAVLGTPVRPITAAHPSVVRLDALNAFFARALSRVEDERPADAGALFASFEQALFGGPYAPAQTLFQDILAADFVVPGVEEALHAMGASDDTSADPNFTFTPEATVAGSRTVAPRRLHAAWAQTLDRPRDELSTAPGLRAVTTPKPPRDPQDR